MNTEHSVENISKPHYPNLDALRFFAFFAVFMSHINLTNFEGAYIPPVVKWFREVFQNGVLGVNFFFVLSAFLITSLLLHEKKTFGKINWRNYFIRRSLRIWPLYFLLLLIFFAVVPPLLHLYGKTYSESAHSLYYIFFAGNFHQIYLGDPYSPVLAVLWSLGIEEQFYIGWIFLFSFLRNKIWTGFLLVVISSIIFRAYLFNTNPDDLGKQLYLNTLSVFSDFGIGALLAYAVQQNFSFIQKLKSIPKSLIAFVYVIFILLMIFYIPLFSSTIVYTLERVILGLFFCFIIFEQSFCINSLFKVGNSKILSSLGKISYGLYVFHPLMIILAKDLLQQWNMLLQPLGYFVLLPLISLPLTILISYLSYEFFEKRFLKLKKKFA